jgi:hypothetical protein
VHSGEGAEAKVRQLEREVEQARRVLASKEQQLYAWQRGLDGERRTGDVLASLQGQGWAVLHDLHWPGRPFANIDHIAIGPTGVFVIDSKNWSGDVIVRQGVLQQNGSRRAAACEGAAAATGAVAAFLEPQHRNLVSAILCLVDQPTPLDQPAQARVLGLDDLAEYLTAGVSRLSAWDVGRIADYLRRLLTGPKSPPMKTTAALDSAGIAPPEPLRARYRRWGAPAGGRRPAAAPRPRARRSRSRGRYNVRLEMLKVAALLVFALVLLPRLMPTITDQLTTRPSVTKPTVVSPAVTSTPKVRVTTKKPSSKGSGTSPSR